MELMGNVESVAMEVVTVCVCSVEVASEQRLKFSADMGVSVSIGTDVSSLGSDWTAVPSGWG